MGRHAITGLIVPPGIEACIVKLNAKQTIKAAEQSGLVYPVKASWRRLFTFAGILSCLMIIGIPLGVWIIYAGRNTRVGLTDEGFAFKGLGSHGWRWDAVEEFKTSGQASAYVQGGGLVGAAVGAAVSTAVAAKTQGLKGPLRFKIKGSGWKLIPAHTIENSVEMAREMERRTGLSILPAPPDGDSAKQSS